MVGARKLWSGGLEAPAGNEGGVRGCAEGCTREHLGESVGMSIDAAGSLLRRCVVEWSRLRVSGGRLGAACATSNDPLEMTNYSGTEGSTDHLDLPTFCDSPLLDAPPSQPSPSHNYSCPGVLASLSL